jgi:UDP-GlcNAc:undecaprenyl-phosphate GlcNAc-1-phosphate transferase
MASFLDILMRYQPYALSAFVIAVFATPIAMRVAHRFGIMDFPDQKLKPHARPTPYLGGAAILLAWSAALIISMVRGTTDWHALLPILLGGIVLSIIGLLDDIRTLPVKLRLAFEAATVAAVIILTGAGFSLVSAVVGPLGLHLPDWVAVPISVLIGIFIVLGAVNSTNLIDGLDGLCSGVTAIISLGFFLLAAHLAVWGFSAQLDPVRLTLALAMLGAALGFLPFNFNPARIFMGDAGSILLGYNCGMLILLFAERSIVRWVLGALVIFALPVADTALAVFRRWRSGKPVFEGDRSHFYDQLVQRGLSVRRTVLICYACTVVSGAIGLLLTWVSDGRPVIRTRYAFPLFLLLAVGVAFLAWRTGLTHPERRDPHGAAAPPDFNTDS